MIHIDPPFPAAGSQKRAPASTVADRSSRMLPRPCACRPSPSRSRNDRSAIRCPMTLVPVIAREAQKAVFSMSDQLHAGPAAEHTTGNAHAHALKRLERRFSARPLVVGERHDTHVELRKVFDFSGGGPSLPGDGTPLELWRIAQTRHGLLHDDAATIRRSTGAKASRWACDVALPGPADDDRAYRRERAARRVAIGIDTARYDGHVPECTAAHSSPR